MRRIWENIRAAERARKWRKKWASLSLDYGPKRGFHGNRPVARDLLHDLSEITDDQSKMWAVPLRKLISATSAPNMGG